LDGYGPSRKHQNIWHRNNTWFEGSPSSSPPSPSINMLWLPKKNTKERKKHPPFEEVIVSPFYHSLKNISSPFQNPWNLLKISVKNTKIIGRLKCFSKMKSLIGIVCAYPFHAWILAFVFLVTCSGGFFIFLFWGSWAIDEAFSGYYDSSSPDGAASSAASKNIVSERNRRKKLNERLFALRAVVPNISKVMTSALHKFCFFLQVLSLDKLLSVIWTKHELIILFF